MMLILQQAEKLIDTWFACLPRSRPATLKNQQIHLIAHRGAHAHRNQIIENTMEAFDLALHSGCSGIELDVHSCADGTLVVNHDSSLKRLWGQPHFIQSLSYEKLHQLAPKVPKLSDVIERYGQKMHLFIEIKFPFNAIESLTDTLKPLIPCEDYHFLTLTEELLPQLTSFPKESLILVPIHNNVNHFCNLSLEQHYGGVLGHYLFLTNRHVSALKAANQMVGVGFVDSKFSLYRELPRGLSILFSNNIGKMTQIIKDLDCSTSYSKNLRST